MIISASRRTDIPAFYPNWFIQRLKDGFAYVQNPFNSKTVYNISLSPEIVDFIVFWTKNPKPILDKLGDIENLGFRDYYFLFTLNHYKTLERNLPSLEKRIDTFQKLSQTIGPDKIIWRYDPIIISDTYGDDYHKATFERIARELSGFTFVCKTSFLTHYSKIRNRIKNDLIIQVNETEKIKFITKLRKIADQHNIKLELCCEELKGLEQQNTGCINKLLIEKLIHSKLDLKRDKNQRGNCQCVSSIDIGAYNTCNHQCTYCYANIGNVNKSIDHSVTSPLLAKEFDIEKHVLLNRKVQSNIITQNNELNLFG